MWVKISKKKKKKRGKRKTTTKAVICNRHWFGLGRGVGFGCGEGVGWGGTRKSEGTLNSMSITSNRLSAFELHTSIAPQPEINKN